MQYIPVLWNNGSTSKPEVQAKKQNMIRLPRTSLGEAAWVGHGFICNLPLMAVMQQNWMNEWMNCREAKPETGPRQIVVNILSRCST